MNMPTGTLLWGQAGHFDASYDRFVITALATDEAGVGVVRPVALTAVSGLQVRIAGGWVAIADCGDGTLAVIGSRNPLTFDLPAGGSAARRSYLWADVDPDGAEWRLTLISAQQMSARASGVALAGIDTPANANLASACTFHPAGASFGSARTSMLQNDYEAAGTMGGNETRRFFAELVPGGQPGRRQSFEFELRCVGWMLSRQGVLRLGLVYAGGIAHFDATMTVALGDPGVPQVHRWHKTPTGNYSQWQTPRAVPANTYFHLIAKGQITLDPASSLGHGDVWALGADLNTTRGSTVRVNASSYLKLQRVIFRQQND